MADNHPAKEVVMTEATTENAKQEKPVTHKLTVTGLQSQIDDIIKAVVASDPRQVSRVVRRFFTATRKQLNAQVLKAAIELNLTEDNQTRKELLGYVSQLPLLPEPEEKTELQPEEKTATNPSQQKQEELSLKPTEPVPEVQVYLALIVTVSLIDNKLNEAAMTCSSVLVSRLQNLNRRTLNPLAARAYFYYSRSFELADRLAEIRQTLLAAHRTSSLRHDDETHATLLNLLLRNYLHYNLVDQADKLQAKSTLDDSTSSNQLARFRYYQGRIKGIQLDYTGAYSDLQEAIRKAPQNSARGFRLTVQKFECIVQLLMGEVPERSAFRQKGLTSALKPYLQLTQAVRVGDLDAFHSVVKQFGDVFRADKTLTLIQRLRHNVIKTGLRKISVSYSRIHLAEISEKLRLDNAEDVEFIVAKAIRDGVIDATIDHENAYIQSKENTDVYSTQEPLEAYHARINFCLKMHNEAVKAMRYPPEAPKASVFDEKKDNDKDDKEDTKEDRHDDDLELD